MNFCIVIANVSSYTTCLCSFFIRVSNSYFYVSFFLYPAAKFRNAELGLSRKNDMLSLLTDLKETNNQHRLAVHRIKEDHPELKFPQLYVEMFFTDDSTSLPGAV